jgi:Selenocysteine lyase
LASYLDQDYDIAVRTGYHCAPLVHKLIGTESSKGTVRASVSFFNTEEDVGQIVAAIKEL